MTVVDLISQANSIVGFAILMVSTAAGLGVWVHKRMKAVATDVSKVVLESLKDMDVRLKSVESATPAQGAKLEAVERAVANLGSRMQAAETAINTMPTSTDIHALALSLSRIEGDLGRFDERLKPIGAIADRLQEILLQNGAQK
jgi:hypothetical protein